MNTRYHAIAGFLILLIGLLAPTALLAQEMVIESANPSEAEQGTANLEVAINGDGFDKSVKEVKFLVSCEQPCPDDPGGVVVNSFRVNNSKKITAYIDIGAEAKLSSYDITVSSRGRGGKGTTYRGEGLFSVKLRPNQELLECHEIVGNVNDPDPVHRYKNSCTCQFIWNGDDAFLPALVEDCVTSETLYLKRRIRGNEGGSSDGSGNTTITARLCDNTDSYEQDCSEVLYGNFSGTTVIANTSHRASIRYIDIRFQGVDRGCGNGIESAVSFVLDGDLPDPTVPEPLNRNSFLNVRDIGIFSGGQYDEPLCHAIEIIRTDRYTDLYSSDSEIARDWKVYINDNFIEAGSYEQAGLVMLGMMPSEDINPPQVVGNNIGAANCGLSGQVGILFGDLTLDPDRQIAGVVENNVIDMDINCTTDTGILVIGDPDDDQTSVNVNKNTVTGAYLGADVHCDVAKVNFSGNILTGNDWPVGILSKAQVTDTKGKPNRISGYTSKISIVDCSP